MVTVSIQAGGRSKRMGENKALLNFQGIPLIQRIVNRIELISDEITIIAQEPELYQFLNLPIFPDKIPGIGVLGGIYTAFCTTTADFIIPVGCDMPFISPRLLMAEVELLNKNKFDIVIPESEDGLESLYAVYRRETCLQPLENAIRSGEKRVISWFDKVKVKTLTMPEVEEIDPFPFKYINLNTREDFEKAELIVEPEIF
jgi:molybdopterin-guanine dinucleotide biosynthesis protein A